MGPRRHSFQGLEKRGPVFSNVWKLSGLLAVLLLTASPPAQGALGTVTGIRRSGDTLTLSINTDTVVVQVCRANLVRVNYLPGGKSSPATLLVGTTNWPAVGAAISTNADPIVIATSNLTLRIARSPCRLALYDAAGTNLLLNEQSAEGVFADGVKLDHRGGSDFYGINGFNVWDDSSAGMLRNSGGWVEAGYQGDCGAPLAWSRDGYGILVDSDGGQFSIGTGTLTFEYCSRTNVEFYLAAGAPDDLLSALTEVSGRPPMFPKWALGFANTEWGIDQTELTNIVAGYRSRAIPLDHYIVDFDWKAWGEDNYGEWRWNTSKFPGGPSGALYGWLAARGVRLSGIMKPRIHVNTTQGAYAGANGFWWSGTSYEDYFSGLQVNDLNFAGSACRTWYWDHLTNAFATGIRGYWNDEADQRGGGGGFFDNWQFMNMQKALYDGQRALTTQRVWSINRNFYLGAQRYAYAMWSGDIDSGFSSMAAQRERMLSALNLGQARWGMDVGGFNNGDPSAENYARWMQFGALVPVFRVHGNQNQQRQPWVFGSTAENAAAQAIRLRYRLLPYIYSYERRAFETGLGLVRPLVYAFPADANTANYKDAWMFGDALLAAPVMEQGQSAKTVYLPAGTWYDFFRGTRYSGGQAISYSVNSSTWTDIPLFVRSGAIIPSQPVMNYVGEQRVTNVYVDVWPAATPSGFTYYEDDGVSYAYENGAYFKQQMSAQDTEGAVLFRLAAPTGTYSREVQYFLCRVYCTTGMGVTLNGAPLDRYASTAALEGATGEGWAEEMGRFGYTVWLKLAAGAEKNVEVTNNLVAAPLISPDGGTFHGSVLVTLTTVTAGATTRFTLDGSIPSESSAEYREPILLAASATLKARSFKDGRTPSGTAMAQFMVDANLLNNPGFETPGSSTNVALYWDVDDPDLHGEAWGNARRVNWRAHAGSWEGTLRGTWAGAGSSGGFWQEVPATPGRRYRYTAWFWADSSWSPGAQGMKLEFFSGATKGETLLQAATNFLTGIGETWVERSMEGIAPSNATWARVVIFTDNASANGALQFDDLALEPTNTWTLTVHSPHGSPNPPVGATVCNAGQGVTNSVDSPVLEGNTQYVCTGWSLLGHSPAAGTSNRFSMVMTNNTILHWLWATNTLQPCVLALADGAFTAAENAGTAYITVVRSGSSNGEVSIAYATAPGSASPGLDYQSATGVLTLADGVTSNRFAVELLDDLQDEPDETVAVTLFAPSSGATLGAPSNATLTITDNDTAAGQRTLTVNSAVGTPTPAAGAHSYDFGSALVCSVVTPPGNAATQHVCSGWSGSGSVPPSGAATNTPRFLLTNDSVLTWNWSTQVRFTPAAGPNGSVGGDPAGWYPLGGSVTATATPVANFRFAGWSGDVPEALTNANPLTLTMDQARAVTARFTASAGANLLNNPGFEQGGSGSTNALYWTVTEPDAHGETWGSGARMSWRYYSGSWEGTIRGTWANLGTEGGFWQEVPAQAGRDYRFSAWFWADDGNPDGPWSAGSQVMKIEFFTGATGGVTMVSAVTGSISGVVQSWTNLALVATAPATADWVRVVIHARDVGSSGALQFDDLKLEVLPALAAPALLPAQATNTTSFTARWGAVDDATGYLLDVATNPAFSSRSYAADLFISEYSEGAGNNRYIEIYNGTGQAVDLTAYRLLGIRNGGNWSESSIRLSNSLPHDTVYVIRNQGCTNVAIINAATHVAANSPPMDFSGDDAVGLGKVVGNATNLIDAVGKSGGDPGSGWGVAGVADGTFDHTLVRKSSVRAGNADWSTCSNEWSVFAVDTFTYLGAHTMSNTPDHFVGGYQACKAGATTSLIVTGLQPQVTYYYRVRATNEATISPYSGTGEATTRKVGPSQHASQLVFSDVGTDHMTLAWIRGDGSNRIVVVRPGTDVDWTPADGQAYAASNDFRSAIGDQAGGHKISFNGPGSNVTLLGLSAGTVYFARIFEYNGTGETTAYLTEGTPASGSHATLAPEYTITAAAGPHGRIEPAGAVSVALNQATSFVVTADAFYHIAQVLTNQAPTPSVAGLGIYTSTWADVAVPGTVEATFAPDTATNNTTPHWWLAEHGLTNATTDFNQAELLDTDEDGMPAWAEFVANLDPKNSNSVLALASRPSGAGSQVVLAWPSGADRLYSVWFASNLASAFFELTNSLPATVPWNMYTTPAPAGVEGRFYKVKAHLTP